MHKFIFFLFICFACLNVEAQDSIKKYSLAIHFNSICCGVPDDAILKKEIRKFRKTYHIKSVSALKVSPLGREGEYDLYFSLKDIPRKRRGSFTRLLQRTIPKLTDKGNASLEFEAELNKSALPANVEYKKVYF
jgi:hypothetical protein